MKSLIAAFLLVAGEPQPAGSGTTPAIMVSEATLPTHTVYRPANFDRSERLPVLVWGNGGCVNLGNSAAEFLTEIASHGYLVVAVGPIGSPPPRAPRAASAGTPRPHDADGVWRPQTDTRAMIRAIDWALGENSRSDSPYRGWIDPTRIAVAGHSCGGLLALGASRDPRVTTSLVMNSGALNDGTHPQGVEVTKATLQQIHGPILYVTGGPDDVAHPNAVDDVSRIRHVPVVLAYDASGHSGTYRQPRGGAYARMVVDWLDWRLKGDAEAAAAFSEGGRLRSDPAWTISTAPPSRE
jgi:dienelactone hydrolase